MADRAFVFPPESVNPVSPGDTQITPLELLDQLRATTLGEEQRRRAVTECEFTEFDDVSIPELNHILREYIEAHRDSNDRRDLAAVGSAIRKYVATMHRDDLMSVAVLLDAGHRAPVPIDVELEVAKMVVRKLTANLPSSDDSAPELADRLMDVAEAYLSPRLLSREKYGAVALNSVLALLLLRSRHTPELLERVRSIKVIWFTQLLGRRLQTATQAISARLSGSRAKVIAEGLDDLAKEFSAAHS